MSNLTYCSINTCQNNGQCFLNTCNCTICYTGLLCEQEKYSQNLWELGISNENRFKYDSLILTIALCIISFFSLISNFLALQTYLSSEKIRITNLGIYLILYSFGCLIVTTILFLFGLLQYIGLVLSTNVIRCAFIRLISNSIVFCLVWLNLYIAIERALIEYNIVGLYDRKRRSLILCLLLYILIPLSNILPIIFGRKPNYSLCTLNLTSTGYFFYSNLQYVHYLVGPFAFTISFIFIIIHLFKHRRNLTDEETIFKSICLIMKKHYGFCVPLVIFTALISPYFVLGKVMTCGSANTSLVGKMTTITNILSNLILALTFLMYVYPSSVYMNAFWQSSYCGRILIYLKRRFWKKANNLQQMDMSVIIT
ncbi:unnamed protein product [Adineta steineri]|uniref:G-protein coupled receptors family 1 profile domain-containing protein n=2 Tax=Adineta steineri TaxID=433720 RepID=A0A819U917_9BILA|nr:unnamed protein product [Adineta steineri]CAF4090993.1 unnamed protein product [Adineta steineri]